MATIPGSFLGAPCLQLSDDDGNPVSGGKLYSYQAGTSTPQQTFTDVDLLVANANPTILDAGGRATVYLGPVAYKFILKDATDVQLWERDDIEDIGQTLFTTLGIDIGAPFAPPTTRTLVSGNTIGVTDQLILVNSTGGADPCIINLPPAASFVQPSITIKNLGTVALAITPDGTDVLELVPGPYALEAAAGLIYPSVILTANSAAWYIMAGWKA